MTRGPSRSGPLRSNASPVLRALGRSRAQTHPRRAVPAAGRSRPRGSPSNPPTAGHPADESVPAHRSPQTTGGGALSIIAAITAFSLLGLALRAVPIVFAGDVIALTAGPRAVVPTASPAPASTTPTTTPAITPTRWPAAKLHATTESARKKVIVPATGPRTYDAADERVKPASYSGRLIRFDVKVEDNLDIDPDAAGKVIAGILNDERSWRGSGRWSSNWSAARSHQPELHAYIATPGTTDRLCTPLLTRGKLSCRKGNHVVLNGMRWLLGAESYGTDLANYRRYLVNHEFGHYIGYGHREGVKVEDGRRRSCCSRPKGWTAA